MGVEKEVLRPGTGPKPVPGQNVTVHCTGYGYPLSLSLSTFFFPFLSLMFLLLLFFQGKMVISLKNFGGKDCTTFLFIFLNFDLNEESYLLIYFIFVMVF